MRLTVFLLGATLGACSRGGSGGGSHTDPPRLGPTVLMDPLSSDFFPFPSDFYTWADSSSPTGLSLHFPQPWVPAFLGLSELERLDGFSRTARLVVAFDRPLGPATLPDPMQSDAPASSVQLLDVDPSSPTFGARLRFIAELDPWGLGMKPPATTLSVKPLYPLAPGRRHAIVVTRGLTGEDGSPVEPSATFAAIRDGLRVSPELADFAGETRDVLDAMAQAPFDPPVPRSEVALALPFTTMSDGSAMGGMLALRDAVIREAGRRPPTVRIVSVERRSGSAALSVRGKMSAFVFQDTNGHIDPAAYATSPLHAPEHEIDFLLTLPLSAASRPARIVIFQHGIDNQKESLYRISEQMAKEGIAVVGIDAVQHGQRWDGKLIPALEFVDVRDIVRFRDNVRQTIADMVQEVRAVRGPLAALDLLPEGAPDGRPDLEVERVGLVGESLGGMLGSIFLAVEPDVGAGVLFVSGGSWTEVALESYYVQPGGGFYWMIPFLLDILKVPPRNALAQLSMGQAILDAGDMLTFSSHTVSDPLPGAGGPKHVLHSTAIGDQTIPNPSSEGLARAFPLPLLGSQTGDIPGLVRATPPVRGNGPGGVTAGIFPFATVNGGEPASHDAMLDSREGMELMTTFLTDFFNGEVPRIVDPTR